MDDNNKICDLCKSSKPLEGFKLKLNMTRTKRCIDCLSKHCKKYSNGYNCEHGRYKYSCFCYKKNDSPAIST